MHDVRAATRQRGVGGPTATTGFHTASRGRRAAAAIAPARAAASARPPSAGRDSRQRPIVGVRMEGTGVDRNAEAGHARGHRALQRDRQRRRAVAVVPITAPAARTGREDAGALEDQSRMPADQCRRRRRVSMTRAPPARPRHDRGRPKASGARRQRLDPFHRRSPRASAIRACSTAIASRAIVGRDRPQRTAASGLPHVVSGFSRTVTIRLKAETTHNLASVVRTTRARTAA